MEIYPVFLGQAGCRQHCIFCSRWQVAANAPTPDPATVAAQLEAQLPVSGSGEVAFYGGSFTALEWPLQAAYLAAVAPALAAGRVSGIRLSTRPDAIDDALCQRLLAAGVQTVELGCQSFAPRVLRASARGHDAAASGRAVAALRRAGLRVGLQLMPGLPGADLAEARFSLAAALALEPDFLRIYPTLVLAGSRLEREWRAGAYRPLELDAAVDLCADLLHPCRLAGVPVIRLGLQGDAQLDRGAGICAGPYHPAFGQLVRARLWRRALATLIEQDCREPIHVPAREFSDAIGHRRANFDYFAGRQTPLVLRTDPGLAAATLRQGREVFSLLHLAAQHNED
ncbi:radical SAM protein [Desulfuromonas carbonis]|uniref:elongator complex protein 3 n=1 Tax=Desulfuromonas sp. DDH964 TaxID=1823759 RepID=UPI00078B7A09|nr:radical SAM protein [Desulfuromonas sp. DDH964]AMV71995.1 radical SAM domain-containing iron-sulfur cluster-binding oxidoreductase [Desulfuromonas sp. DDH964]